MTVCVSDLAAARRFFGLLGLAEDKAVVIAGEPFATYMDVAGIEADHVTLVLSGASPRLEVQFLHYRHPEASGDPIRRGSTGWTSASQSTTLRRWPPA